jgi:hypothetical protein
VAEDEPQRSQRAGVFSRKWRDEMQILVLYYSKGGNGEKAEGLK